MRKILCTILVVLMLHINVYAGESKSELPIRLKTGNTFKVKKDGWFFTDIQEQRMRIQLMETGYIEKQLKLKDNIIDSQKIIILSEKNIADRYHKAWLESDEHLTKVLKRENRTKFWYLTLGVLLTIGAGLAVGFSAKAVK